MTHPLISVEEVPPRHARKRYSKWRELMPIVERLHAEGYTNKQIANRLGVSDATIYQRTRHLWKPKKKPISVQRKEHQIATLAFYGVSRGDLLEMFNLSVAEYNRIIKENPME